MTVLESQLRRSVLAWLRREFPRAKWISLPASAFTYGGEPDILGCLEGRAVAIELKRPGCRSTPRQQLVQLQWRRAGAAVAEIHSLAELKAFVAGVLRENRQLRKEGHRLGAQH